MVEKITLYFLVVMCSILAFFWNLFYNALPGHLTISHQRRFWHLADWQIDCKKVPASNSETLVYLV